MAPLVTLRQWRRDLLGWLVMFDLDSDMELTQGWAQLEGGVGQGLALVQDGVLRTVDMRFAKIFGYPRPEELCGRPLVDLIEPMSREGFEGRDPLVADKPFETVGLKKKGQVFIIGLLSWGCDFGGLPAKLTAVLERYQDLEA
jgi:PAS domain-containing protein